MPHPIRLASVLFTLATSSLAGCATPPANLDLSLDKASSSGAYRIALAPPATAPKINQIHSWTVTLSDTAGKPVSGAVFTVGGGMPQHGHGLPTKPRVSDGYGNGTYRLDGMKFSMPGWWEIKLDIQGPNGPDSVTFNTVVTPPHKA